MVQLLDEDEALTELVTDRERFAARRALTATAYGADLGIVVPVDLTHGEQLLARRQSAA